MSTFKASYSRMHDIKRCLFFSLYHCLWMCACRIGSGRVTWSCTQRTWQGWYVLGVRSFTVISVLDIILEGLSVMLLCFSVPVTVTIGGVHAPYVQLSLRPRVWIHCASSGQEVSSVVLQPSHICIHIYIHVDGAWCVCGALPYSSRMD